MRLSFNLRGLCRQIPVVSVVVVGDEIGEELALMPVMVAAEVWKAASLLQVGYDQA